MLMQRPPPSSFGTAAAEFRSPRHLANPVLRAGGDTRRSRRRGKGPHWGTISRRMARLPRRAEYGFAFDPSVSRWNDPAGTWRLGTVWGGYDARRMSGHNVVAAQKRRKSHRSGRGRQCLRSFLHATRTPSSRKEWLGPMASGRDL